LISLEWEAKNPSDEKERGKKIDARLAVEISRGETHAA
jgi:hypothetical protein